MDAALTLLYLVAAGVNYGWQPAKDVDAGYEYTVQVEPELLDLLRRGEAVPIESNVPAEVAPIRKVRVVVGRGPLPRDTVSAVNRTAYFAGQAGWTPDRYGPIAPAATRSGERYPPPSLPPRSNVGPPPSVVDRAQAAVTETGDTLRDGVEAGIRAANEQLSRGGEELLNATRDAGQEFGEQLQDWTNDPARELQATGNDVRVATQRTLDTVGNRLQQVTNPFVTTDAPAAAPATRGGVAPPPWTDSSATLAPAWTEGPAGVGGASIAQGPPPAKAAASPAAGWTSIGGTVAAPPLIIPQMSTTPRRSDANPAGTLQSVADGPQFPDQSLPRRESIHSPLTDPAQQATAAGTTDDWSTGWDTRPALPQVSINRAGNTLAVAPGKSNADLVAVEPIATQQQDQRPTSQFEDVWDNAANWGQAAQSLSAVTVGPEQHPSQPTNQSIQGPANTVAETNAGLNVAPPAGAPTANRAASLRQIDERPWLPLLAVSLSLMGSLGANLFLGWSYMDARQKYRTLVRKTADKFRRAAAA